MKIKFLMIALILLMACKSNPEKDTVISEEKMIEILVDVQITEAYFLNNDPSIRSKDFNTLSPQYYKYIFEKHQITKAQFDESMKFYVEDLPTFKILFDSVTARLDQMKDSLNIKIRNVND